MRALLKEIDALPSLRRFGRVARIEGLLVEVTGAAGAISLGGQLRLTGGSGKEIPCEVVGFRQDGRALAMPLGNLDGMSLSARADYDDRPAVINTSTAWLGRVLDGFGQPQDGKGPLTQGAIANPIKAQAPAACTPRGRVGGKLDLGVRALNTFVTCCKGQRMGIFSGSGVGKSTLLAMLARNTKADAIVIGLIGERGREVKEFVEDDLGVEGLARSVVVAATSDDPPLVRRQAAYVAMTVAEQLRDQGLHVLLLMDSVTRFAMAQREARSVGGANRRRRKATPPRCSPNCRVCWSARAPAMPEAKVPSRDCSRFSSKATITMNRFRTRCAESSTAILCWNGTSPSVDASPRLTSLSPAPRAPCPLAATRRRSSASWPPRAFADGRVLTTWLELIRLGAYKIGTNAEVDSAIKT